MENQKILDLIKFINIGVNNAEKNTSKIRTENLTKYLKGFNSIRVRHLLNNLNSIEGSCYLEFGSYRGASLVCALHKNIGIGYTVDNFKYNPFQNPNYKEEGWIEVQNGLRDNIKRFVEGNKANVIKGELESFNLKLIEHPISVFYYDAYPTKGNIYNYISRIAPKFAKYCIVITNHVRTAGSVEVLERVFKELEFTIHHEVELKSYHPEDYITWWSGIKIWLIEKEKPLTDKERIAIANAKTTELQKQS